MKDGVFVSTNFRDILSFYRMKYIKTVGGTLIDLFKNLFV